MLENFWEALDEANEWFYDEARETLYLIPNNTAAATDTGIFQDRAAQ